MKRIAFSLCATIVSLSTTAQGTLLKRLQGNPMIDSLANYVYNIGTSVPDWITYSYDGKYHKTVRIQCILTNDFHPTPATGDPKKDLLNQRNDSIIQDKDADINRGIMEIGAGVLSKKKFMVDTLGYTEEEAQKELAQIAEERKTNSVVVDRIFGGME